MTDTVKRTIAITVLLFSCLAAGAQSKGFSMGKWTEIHGAVLKELNQSYVDSLPVDRIERAAIDAMLSNLDPYTMYVPEEEDEDLQMMINRTYGGIGAVIYKPDKNGNVIINEPYEGSPAQRAGLSCGDEILEIDSQSVVGLSSKEASERMKGKPGTEVVFKVQKLRGPLTEMKITRERIHLPDIEYAGMLDSTHGYILLSGFTEGVSQELRKEISALKEKGMQELFLDLRGNGGGLLQEAVEIVSIFVPKGSVVVTSKGNELVGSNTLKTMREPLDTRMSVVVLVDGASASASEIVSGALQDMDRATIMGRRTYGKGLVQSFRALPYNGKMKITTAKYYTPSGRCVQIKDYSHRNEDGSVGNIPDSLTREFRTAHGRIVRDGGGITPDVVIEGKNYSRLVYSLVAYGVIEQYAMEYVRTHESIPAVEDFHFNEYERFIEYAKGKDFDYRSGAKTLYDEMRSELRKDGLEESMKDELDALGKALEMDKETFLRLKESEIIPFIEEDIAVRYYFQKAGIKIRLRYDDVLREALTSERIKVY